MFKIGEFSKLVRVSQRMLRHYEKCGLIVPAEIDSVTGYRRYSAAQVPVLMHITALRDMGFSIEEIGRVLPHVEDAAYMDTILAEKSAEVKTAIRAEREKLRRLADMRNHLIKEKSTMQYEVQIKELPAVNVLSLRDTLPDYSQEGTMWERMGGFLAAHGITCPTTEESGYSIYLDDGYKEADVAVEIAVPVERPGESEGAFVYKQLAGIPLAATLRFEGPYEGYSAAISRLAAWIEANGYEMCGGVRGVAIRTPADQSNPQNFLTELQVPIRRA